MIKYTPKLAVDNENLLATRMPTAWRPNASILKDIIDSTGIKTDTALEFGTEWGYSSSALAQYFDRVICVDVFDKNKNQVYQTAQLLHSYKNITIVKEDLFDFIKYNNGHYDLIHVDIIHDYENTYSCGKWALEHSDCVIFHDTESFADVKKVCEDLAKEFGFIFYNFEKEAGLGILTKKDLGGEEYISAIDEHHVEEEIKSEVKIIKPMKIKVITVVNNPHGEGFDRLIATLELYDWDYQVIVTEWKGFSTKINEAKKYLETIKDEYTHFIFVDGFDVMFLSDEGEFRNKLKESICTDSKMIFNCEKICWVGGEDKERAKRYPETTSDWKYLNSGAYFSPINLFIDLVERNPVEYSYDDQRYFTDLFLKGEPIQLDNSSLLFQCYSFINDDDFSYNYGRVQNLKNKTEPIIFHGNGRTNMEKLYTLPTYTINSVEQVKAMWKDEPIVHAGINTLFTRGTNITPQLKAHRDWVEQNVFGFGERSFHWEHYLIAREMPSEFTFLEIGVFKGQILSLYELLAEMFGKKVKRYGITPLDSTEIGWTSDYAADIELIHDTFHLEKDYSIFKGLSTDEKIISQTRSLQADVVFIDGGHTYDVVLSDARNYAPLVKSGCFLIFDDANSVDMKMPFGYFQGIKEVGEAVLQWEKEQTDFEFCFSVVHNRVYRRK